MPANAKIQKKPKYEPVRSLPPLPHDQYKALKANIAVNGILVPIVVDCDGPKRKIIDGKYRKRIAIELGYECPEVIAPGLEDDEMRTLARALNLARRQLNTDRRRGLIADQLKETPGWTNRRIAKMLGVTHPTVASVRNELESSGKLYHCPTREGSDGRFQPAQKSVRAFVFLRGELTPRPNTIVTPPGICQFLYDLISPKYKVQTILDPCAGAGALTKPWRKRIVISYEIVKGRDFFTCPNRIACDLVLCNPPFSNDGSEGQFVPYVFLQHILKVLARETPIVLFAPMALRLDQAIRSSRWRWLRDNCPAITSIVTLPYDAYGPVKVHSEILLFNMPKLAAHYFLPDRYLR